MSMTTSKPETFQVSASFGNFETRKEAEDYARMLHGVVPVIPSSVSIRSSHLRTENITEVPC